MAHKAPGKSYRKGITLADIFKMFPDDTTAEAWFVDSRWPDGPACPYCGSDNVKFPTAHKTMPYRCREKVCAKRFSVRTRTLMDSSNIPYQKWAIAIFLMTTNLKGVSSMKLHRDLGISQKSAWFMAHRIRQAMTDTGGLFSGPVEVDETFVGGREHNKHGNKKIREGRGTTGQVAVAGVKDRATGRVIAQPVARTDKQTLQDFVHSTTAEGAEVYTDDLKSYTGLKNHKTVKHSVRQYVDGKMHTNGIESFWAMFKRGHKGTYHKMSRKHLQRYVNEFVGRHNKRPSDTLDQMDAVAKGMDGKRLKYAELIEPNGLESGARPSLPL